MDGAPFSFRDEDMAVGIDLPPESMCVAFSAADGAGPSCEPKPGVRSADLQRTGGRLILVARRPTDAQILFTLTVNEKTHGAFLESAFAQGAIDQAKEAQGITLVQDLRRSAAVRLSEGKVAHRLVFDAHFGPEATERQRILSHWVVLAIPGRAHGLHTLSWHTSPEHAKDVEWSAERALTRLRGEAAVQALRASPDPHRENKDAHLPPEEIQRRVRANFGAMRECYEDGLRRRPDLAGEVVTKFVIDREGHVAEASSVETADQGGFQGNGGVTTMPDRLVVDCVRDAYMPLTFPKPEGGIVTVVYPLVFSPGN
jgi:hypothetical protein